MGSKLAKSKPVETKPAADSVTDKDRALLDLKRTRDKLNKFQKQTEKDSARLYGEAKSLVSSGNKDKALMLLKIKKFKENQIQDVNSKLLTVYEMMDKIEWAAINVQALNALKDGTAALNKLNEQMKIEDVEILLQESEDAIEMERTIAAQLFGSLDSVEDIEALNSELEALMKNEASTVSLPIASTAEAKQAAVSTELPAVPTHDIITANTLPEVPDHAIETPESASPQRALVSM